MSLVFKRVLCPVDLSDPSLAALRIAAQFAAKDNAILDVLHVIDNPLAEIYATALKRSGQALLDADGVRPLALNRRMTEENAEILLKTLCKEIVYGLSDVRYHLRRDDPFERISEATEDLMTDVVIMATHGRAGLKRLLLGSVAEKVVRHAACPVLTVNPETCKFQDQSDSNVKGGADD